MIFFRCVYFILCIWAFCLNVYEHRQLWVTMWVLGMEPGSSARAASALSQSLSLLFSPKEQDPLTTEPSSPYCDKCISIYCEWYVQLNNTLDLHGRVSFRGCWQCCSALPVEQEATLGVYLLQWCFSQGSSKPPCLDGRLWKVLPSPVHVQPTEWWY